MFNNNNNNKSTTKSRDYQQHLHMYDPYTSSMTYQGQYYASYLQQRYGYGYYHGHGHGWYSSYPSNIAGTTVTPTLLGRPGTGANHGRRSRGNKNKQKKTNGTGSRSPSPTSALVNQNYNSNDSNNKQTPKILASTGVTVNVADATNPNSSLNPNACVFVPKNTNQVTRASSPVGTIAPSPVKNKITVKITNKATDTNSDSGNVQAPFVAIANDDKVTKTKATTLNLATVDERPSVALRATAYNVNKPIVKAPPGFAEPTKKPGNDTAITTTTAAAPSVMSYASAVRVSLGKGKLTTSAKPQDGMGTASSTVHIGTKKVMGQNSVIHEPKDTFEEFPWLGRVDDKASKSWVEEQDDDNNENQEEEDSDQFAFTNSTPKDILRQRHGIVFAQDPSRFHK